MERGQRRSNRRVPPPPETSRVTDKIHVAIRGTVSSRIVGSTWLGGKVAQVNPLLLRSTACAPATISPASTRLCTVTRSHCAAPPRDGGQPPSGGPASAEGTKVAPSAPMSAPRKIIRFALAMTVPPFRTVLPDMPNPYGLGPSQTVLGEVNPH